VEQGDQEQVGDRNKVPFWSAWVRGETLGGSWWHREAWRRRRWGPPQQAGSWPEGHRPAPPGERGARGRGAAATPREPHAGRGRKPRPVRSIWRRFGVRAWPTAILVDRQGIVRHRHIGEGAYGETEAMIRRLLAERHW